MEKINPIRGVSGRFGRIPERLTVEKGAQTALAETLRVMGARLVVDATLPFARRNVDADNRVSDPDLAQKLASSLEALLLAIRSR
jgi:hypothetical protein